MAIVPKDHKVRWMTYRDEDVHASFLPSRQPVENGSARFALPKPGKEDDAYAA
jgi:hypothetical protein